jgi:hypothetical protein
MNLVNCFWLCHRYAEFISASGINSLNYRYLAIRRTLKDCFAFINKCFIVVLVDISTIDQVEIAKWWVI